MAFQDWVVISESTESPRSNTHVIKNGVTVQTDKTCLFSQVCQLMTFEGKVFQCLTKHHAVKTYLVLN
jgi:hypothetical protein